MSLECAPNLVDASLDPAEWARAREAEGWPVLAAADHLWDATRAYPHWAVTLTQLAMVTSRPRITSSFANNLLRSPVEFAQAALALQRASGGRFEAGLGAGWAESEITGIGGRYPSPGERAGRYAESMHVVRELFRHGTCTFTGEFVRVDVPRIGPHVDTPPPLVASVGGPRTIREVVPLVDRVELKVASGATRGGALDIAKLADIDVDHLRDLVARVRAVRDDVPIGVFLMAGCGDHPRLAQLKAVLGDGLMGSLVGEPEQVADAIRSFAGHGIERVQITPYTPDTISLLAPHLAMPHLGHQRVAPMETTP
jgi:alkanesulfonate monooxygenase SsuD/methylene tetrahydromethanopterin reductase-like flavin-dependent oxidoreductase (luciferase family)